MLANVRADWEPRLPPGYPGTDIVAQFGDDVTGPDTLRAVFAVGVEHATPLEYRFNLRRANILDMQYYLENAAASSNEQAP